MVSEDVPQGMPQSLDELGVSVKEIEELLPVWKRWVSLDRKYPPSVIASEPQRILSFCSKMDYLLAVIQKIKADETNGNK